MNSLTPKQKLFVAEYTGPCKWNGTKAVIAAGYDAKDEHSAASIANENLRKLEIQNAITKVLQRRLTRIDLSQDKLAQWWAAIVFTPITELYDQGPDGEMIPKPFEELPEAVQLTVGKVSKFFKDDGSGHQTYELLDKMKASEYLGRYLAMFIDRKEIGKAGDFDNLSEEELDRRIAEQENLLRATASKDPKAGEIPTQVLPPIH